MSLSNLSAQGSGIHVKEKVERLEQPEDMDDVKEAVSFRHSRTDAHRNPQGLWQNAQDLPKFKPHKIPAWRKARRQKVPTPNRNSMFNWYLLGKSVSTMKSYWVPQPCSKADCMLTSSCQHKMDSVCAFIFPLLWFYFCLWQCLWFGVVRKNMKLGG